MMMVLLKLRMFHSQLRVPCPQIRTLRLHEPTTPEVIRIAPDTPRASASTRSHDAETNEQESKRARVETSKTQRIERISKDYASKIRAVQFAKDSLYKMDEYETDLRLDDHNLGDAWFDEDEIKFDKIPNELWSDAPLDKKPAAPGGDMGYLLDQVEFSRLCGMHVLEEGDKSSIGQEQRLSTKVVKDWRAKDFVKEDGGVCKRWLLRSRLVAREFHFWRNTIYLQPCNFYSHFEFADSNSNAESVVLGTVDIKDAFLMVDQQAPMAVTLLGKTYKVKKDLPEQRLGVRAWYRSFLESLITEFGMSWCTEQPLSCKKPTLLRDGAC